MYTTQKKVLLSILCDSTLSAGGSRWHITDIIVEATSGRPFSTGKEWQRFVRGSCDCRKGRGVKAIVYLSEMDRLFQKIFNAGVPQLPPF